ncbi:MAG: peptidase domain protein [Ignavibacteria bacterium]|nr:peptidase domain protein [Ignavibacteria bacterium]
MLKKLFIIFAIGMTVMNTQAFSQKFFPLESKTFMLKNGLTVILVPMKSHSLLSYYTVVRTGSRDEYEPGHTGFAHFFEHMMFRGTKKYPGNVYDKLVTEMGANANAYTTDDLTCYHLSIASEDLEKTMELESDRFRNLFYQEREFQTESGAVYGEYRKSKTSPEFWLEEKLAGLAFAEHTYKHTTMGFEEDIAAMPKMYDYSRSFFSRYYRPENAVLLIVGDFRQDEAMRLVEKYYSPWQRGYVPPQIPKEPEQTREKSGTVKYPGKTLPILAISYKGASFDPNDKLIAAASLFCEMAFGENSDLYKKLYLQEQKVQEFGYDFGMNRDPGLWSIYSKIKKIDDLGYIRTEIDRTIKEFQTNPVSQTKLDNLKKRKKYEFLMNLDTPEKVAGKLTRIIAMTGGIAALDKHFSTIMNVNPQDIIEAAKKYFVPEKRTVLTLTGE